MKIKKFTMYLTLLALSMLLMQCVKEGPMGPAGPTGPAGADGTDGTDGVDGNVTCLVCHSSQAKADIDYQYAQSGHAIGEVTMAEGEWSASCAKCHTQEGFINYANGETAVAIGAPVRFDCVMCHSIHETFTATDYAFRLADPIAFIFDATVVADLGNSNVCSNCHQSRRAEPNITNPGATFNITSTHYGPHHGAQSNILYGVGMAEIAGTYTYEAAGSSPHMNANARCTGCHMYEFADGEGGHTFSPSLASCNSCHTTTSFDYHAVQTETAALLLELRDSLVNRGVLEYVVADDAYEPIVGVHDMAYARAFFNWIAIEEDRSLGVHNPVYVKALLENSIAVTGAVGK
jgi:formate-dependent nitrite reductase cytochrome c552 subunit